MSRTETVTGLGLVAGIRAILGAVGFLTRIPVGTSESAWSALCRFPAAMVVVAYPVGLALSAVVVFGAVPTTAGLLFPVAVVGLLGITHLDGVADIGDAAVVHGDPADRRTVMRDTTVGVGATAAVVLVLAGLVLAAVALAGAPWPVAVTVVLAAEVTAKFGMVALAGVGTATHDGLGSALSERTGLAGVALAGAVWLPAAVGPLAGSAVGYDVSPVPAAAAAVCGLLAVACLYGWARRALGGISGDVLGAGNELARLTALHAGVVAWSL